MGGKIVAMDTVKNPLRLSFIVQVLPIAEDLRGYARDSCRALSYYIDRVLSRYTKVHK